METEATRTPRSISIRRAEPSDVHTVAELIRAYAREVFMRQADVTPEALLGDGFGSVLEFFIAEYANGELCGFAAWEKTYDIVSGRRGGLLLGQFITPLARGMGIGDRLLHAVATEVRSIGGAFLGGLSEQYAELSTIGASLVPPATGAQSAHSRKYLVADLSSVEVANVTGSLRPRA